MKVRMLDKFFFDLYKLCPKSSVLSYSYKNTLSDGHTNVKIEKTKDRYIEEVISVVLKISILTLIKDGTIDFSKFKKILKYEISRRLKMKENEILDKGKENILKTIELDYEKKIFNMIEARDFENVTESSIRSVVDLNEALDRVKKNYRICGTHYEFQKSYQYNYDIPFITEDNGQYNIIKIINEDKNSYQGIMYDYDLSICIEELKNLYPDRVFKGLIVYNLKDFSREFYKINVSKFSYVIEDLYKTLVIIDSNMSTRNYSNYCEKCINQSACLISKLDKKDQNSLYNDILKGYKRNELEKRKVIKNFIERTRKEAEF